MFNLFSSVTESGVTLTAYIICTLTAFICGIVAAAVSSFRQKVSRSFILALVLLPPITQTVIIMVNGNIGTGVAVMGAFSLVRFRSAAGKASEIASIFSVMTAGLACAAGYIWVALLFTAMMCAAVLIFKLICGKKKSRSDLRVTVPEALSFSDAFDDLFEKYTRFHSLESVKTSNMGSLYKLLYKIEMKNKNDIKIFLDELRCRNGNLEISVCDAVEESEEL
ncbi:MAG: DUF4956 domain-containing protein [Clostridiales bacterium]|nr:DUF4956 domain-containing protein [Clostridiales bacterium]